MASKCMLKLIIKGMFWMVMMVAGVIAFVCMGDKMIKD